jgi:hypothetical protein
MKMTLTYEPLVDALVQKFLNLRIFVLHKNWLEGLLTRFLKVPVPIPHNACR